MILKEYRVVLPLTVDEYHVAQLYSFAETSKQNTGGGEGIEVVEARPFDDFPLLGGRYTKGQYTHKIYHLKKKVPWWVRKLAPAGALVIHEEAWNAYPYCRTVYKNPDYMKDAFHIILDTMHLPDRGTTENAHNLDAATLQQREVVLIDIANDPVQRSDYKESEDPTKFKSTKTGRGPLVGPQWLKSCEPVMCCYKMVSGHFKWFGLQARVESYIQQFERRLFTVFHRQVFCWTDQWYGLTMEDIRRIEAETKAKLDEQMKSAEVRGAIEED